MDAGKYETVQGQRLKSAQGSMPLVYDDQSVAFDEIHLVFEREYLTLSVDPDTDEVVLDCRPLGEGGGQVGDAWQILGSMADFQDLELGWCWLGRNQQGYTDTIILSFSGPEPQMMFSGMAGKLNVYRVVKTAG